MKTGFTLVEVILSISILSIGLVLILQGFAHSLNVLKISEDNLKATLAAENKMSEAYLLAKEDWDRFDNGLDERFEFDDLECNWQIDVTEVEIKIETEGEDTFETETELELEEQQTLNEIKANLAWEEGRRGGKIPVITYMLSTPEEEEKSAIR
ncbi:MAG: type II secretion system protein [Candidatus Omnitrophica bacterium]|nr:type II secretion system protein [Candidatus Omnitrophota bacterium]